MKPLPQQDIKQIANAVRNLTEWSEQRVMLSGGEGFLGRWLQAVLVELDVPPRSLVNMDIINGDDVTDYPLVQEYGEQTPPTLVIHAAGYASPSNYRRRPLATIDAAVKGARNLLNIAQNYDARMLLFSSSEIYGMPSTIPTPEDDKGYVACRGPRSCYDESKRLAETLAYVYAQQHGVNVVTVRPFNVYGPCEQDMRVIPAFARAIQDRKPLQVYAGGRQTRTFCYVTDAIEGCLRALVLGAAGGVYNIGNMHPEITIEELACQMSVDFGLESPVELAPYPDSYPADEPMRRCPDITRAQRELEWSPKVSLTEGLHRYMEWLDLDTNEGALQSAI